MLHLHYVNIEICLYEIGYDIIDVPNLTITVALTRHLFNNFRHYMKLKMRRENQVLKQQKMYYQKPDHRPDQDPHTAVNKKKKKIERT